MKLGMHASAWNGFERGDAGIAIHETKKLGLDFIEIPLTRPEGIRTKAIARKLRESGLEALGKEPMPRIHHA